MVVDTWSRNTFTSNFALHLTQISILGKSLLILLVFGQGLFGPASDILGSATAASTRRHRSIVVPSDGSSEALKQRRCTVLWAARSDMTTLIEAFQAFAGANGIGWMYVDGCECWVGRWYREKVGMIGFNNAYL